MQLPALWTAFALISVTDLATAHVISSEVGSHRHFLSRRSVCVHMIRLHENVSHSQCHGRTVAASITRMVIFIEAVQGLKQDFKTSGDSDCKTLSSSPKTQLIFTRKWSQQQACIGA